MTLYKEYLISSLWNIFEIELHASCFLMLKLRVTSQSVTMREQSDNSFVPYCFMLSYIYRKKSMTELINY